MPFGDIGSAGNNNTIASAQVVVGADLTALRAGEEEAKQIVARIGALVGNVSLGGGGIGSAGGGSFGGTGGSFAISGNPNQGSIGNSGFMATPNMGAIGSASPNLGASNFGAVGFGGVGGVGGIEQAIASATQTAVQGAIARVQQSVSAAVQNYAQGISGTAGVGNRASFAFESVLNGGATYSMEQPLHRTNNIAPNNISQFAFDTPINGGASYSFEQPGYSPGGNTVNGFGGHMASGFFTSPMTGGGDVSMSIWQNQGQYNRFQSFQQRISAQQAASGVGGFGPYGAISRATGIPYAGVIAGAFLVHQTFETAQGIAVANAAYNPALAASELYSPGAEFNLANDPRAVLASNAIAGIEHAQAISAALPGGRLLDAISGRQRAYTSELSFAKRVLGLQGFVDNAYYSQGVQEATLGGNPVEIQRAKNEQSLAAFTNAYLANPTSEALAAASRQNNINSVALQFAQREYAGTLISLAGGEAAAHLGVTGANLGYRSVLEAGGGNEVNSLRFARSAAEVNGESKATAYDAETTGILSKIHDPNTYDVTKNTRNAELQRLRQETQTQLAQIDNQIAEAERRVASLSYSAGAALLGAAGSAYSARLTGLQGQLTALAPNDPNRSLITAQMTAARIDSDRAANLNFLESAAGGASAGLRAQRQFFQASLIDFDAETAANIYRMDKSDPNFQANLQNYQHLRGMNRVAMEAAHNDELQLEREGYAAQVAESNEIMGYRPISARAQGEIARARRQVELASPENRENAINGARAQLRAAQFEMTAQRGGLVAIDMPTAQAIGSLIGSGIDLTGRRADIGHARGLYNDAINDIGNAKLGGAGDSGAIDAETKKAITGMYKLFEKIMSGKTPLLAMFNGS